MWKESAPVLICTESPRQLEPTILDRDTREGRGRGVGVTQSHSSHQSFFNIWLRSPWFCRFLVFKTLKPDDSSSKRTCVKKYDIKRYSDLSGCCTGSWERAWRTTAFCQEALAQKLSLYISTDDAGGPLLVAVWKKKIILDFLCVDIIVH